MGKIIIIGANGAVGKACTANLAEKDLVLISRSEFDNSSENQPNSEKVVLDINNYEKTEGFINSIDYEISGIIFAVGSITLKPFSNTSIDDFKKLMDDTSKTFDDLLDYQVYRGVFTPKEAKKFSKDTIIVVNSCGDAYKDKGIIEKKLGPIKKLGKITPIEFHYGLIPNDGLSRKTVYNNLILVGDTAGQANPLVLEGIRYAIKFGRVAGEVAAKAIKNEKTEIPD